MERDGDTGSLMSHGKVTVGAVVGLHGIAGEIKVKPLTDFPERFSKGRTLELFKENVDEPFQSVSIESVRSHKNNLLIKLENISSRETAGKFIGMVFKIDEKEVMPLPDGTYYHFQIMGLRVCGLDDEYIGIISDILPTPGHDVYVVAGEEEILVPALKKVVKKVDLNAGRMWIDREMISYFED